MKETEIHKLSITIGNEKYQLRDWPYHDDEGLIIPMLDGTNVKLRGSWYPADIHFGGTLETGTDPEEPHEFKLCIIK